VKQKDRNKAAKDFFAVKKQTKSQFIWCIKQYV